MAGEWRAGVPVHTATACFVVRCPKLGYFATVSEMSRYVTILGGMDPELILAVVTTVVKLLATVSWEQAKTVVGGLWLRVHPERAETVQAELAETRYVPCWLMPYPSAPRSRCRPRHSMTAG
jgi:hypothetical protein